MKSPVILVSSLTWSCLDTAMWLIGATNLSRTPFRSPSGRLRIWIVLLPVATYSLSSFCRIANAHSPTQLWTGSTLGSTDHILMSPSAPQVTNCLKILYPKTISYKKYVIHTLHLLKNKRLCALLNEHIAIRLVSSAFYCKNDSLVSKSKYIS